ncbi:MAG: flagellar hook-basal body complex protein FliE [Actinomycetota bacterium]|nr:MAG: flagellar hook-basal body complex protein FliE [Actinomycetota bacterium]
MTTIGPVPPVLPQIADPQPSGSADRGFSHLVLQGLEAVSRSEQEADALVRAMAAGEPVQPHDVMIATAKAELSVQMLVAIRDKALEAYQQVMNLQI